FSLRFLDVFDFFRRLRRGRSRRGGRGGSRRISVEAGLRLRLRLGDLKSIERGHLLARLQVPQAGRLVLADGHRHTAALRQRHAVDAPVVPGDLPNTLAAVQVPDRYRLALGADDLVAAWKENRTLDPQHNRGSFRRDRGALAARRWGGCGHLLDRG